MAWESLNIALWRQFESVSIDFHPQLTVITGANGSGKTAILRLLARHFGWSYDELGVPVLDTKLGSLHYKLPQLNLAEIRLLLRSGMPIETAEALLSSLKRINKLAAIPQNPEDPRTIYWDPAHYAPIGQVRYDGAEETLYANKNTQSATYAISFHQHGAMNDIFIPSHRGDFAYRVVTSIPLEVQGPDALSQQITQLHMTRSLYQTYGEVIPSNLHMKQTLLAWAILGFGNTVVAPNREMMQYFDTFQDVMSRVLPTTLGFRRMDVRPPEIVLLTDTGDFLLDAVSGGIGATLDLAWQIFVRDPSRRRQFAVVIDEVENHLHASMQRSILPGLIDAFPNVQFIVSTHSPLVVGSVRNSSVYALRFNERNKVVSERLDQDRQTGTASDVLRDVLDVPVTTPIWVEQFLNTLAERFGNEAASREALERLRNELAHAGLEEFAPQTITELLDRWENRS